MKKRLFSIILAILMVSVALHMPVCASALNEEAEVKADRQEQEKQIRLYAQAATLMDAASGRILFAKNGEEEKANASTTKILTCITILEAGVDLHQTVEVSAYAAKQPKVHLGMRVGELYRMEDLLYSMMLESHNDSAVALAEAVGRKFLGQQGEKAEPEQAVLAFMDAMNAKAKGMGCEHTFFVTPNGLDSVRIVKDRAKGNPIEKEHKTCANDLARIMAYCVTKSPCREQFVEITETPTYRFQDQSGSRQFECSNRNALLTMREDAVSGKTGFTAAAGYCYVGCVESEGRVYTIALLGAGWPGNKNYKWKDCKTLFDYGEECFSLVNMEPYYEKLEKKIPILVKNGIGEKLFEEPQAYGTVRLDGTKELPDTVLMGDDEQIQVQIDCVETLEAPAKKGQKVGNATLCVGDEMRFEFAVCMEDEIEPRNHKWFLYQICRRYFSL